MFKIQYNLLKCNIKTEKKSDIHHYGTRNADKLHITFNKTNLDKHSVLNDMLNFILLNYQRKLEKVKEFLYLRIN
jgi:hypothetical protein